MRYDAIVIGAGPAGATAALLLARGGWSVALVEKAAFPRPKVCGEFISASALSLLDEMGMAGPIAARAGPEITRVGFYAGDRMITAALEPYRGAFRYGRACGREHLDALLLDAARRAGAHVWQPRWVEAIAQERDEFVCETLDRETGERIGLHAPIVLRAHGSWDTGRIGIRDRPDRKRGTDLLAFKTHFRGGALPECEMPLLAFPGGYAGFVHTDDGRLSVSCCITRKALASCRRARPGASAGPAVWARVLESCRGARLALDAARQEEAWAAAGPMQPGMRALQRDGTFAVGNAMGEAEPSVAEGITIGIQSAWLLAEHLLRARGIRDAVVRERVAREYAADCAVHFGGRVRWSAVVGCMTRHTASARMAASFMQAMPVLLELGAAWSGKRSDAAFLEALELDATIHA